MAWPMLKSQDLVPPSRKALGGHALPHLPETRDPLDREEKRNTKRSPARASQCVNWQLNVLAASKVTKGQLQVVALWLKSREKPRQSPKFDS
jgi:hypothetical protein